MDFESKIQVALTGQREMRECVWSKQQHNEAGHGFNPFLDLLVKLCSQTSLAAVSILWMTQVRPLFGLLVSSCKIQNHTLQSKSADDHQPPRCPGKILLPNINPTVGFLLMHLKQVQIFTTTRNTNPLTPRQILNILERTLCTPCFP